MLSFQIDYQDHYSYFQPSIGPYHFLRYGDRSWRLFNPALHWQNRLRHSDHMALVHDAGFTLVREELVSPTLDELELLRRSPVDKRFSAHSESDLAIRGSRIAARKHEAHRS